MTREPELIEEPGDGMMGLAYSFTKGPVSVDVYEDPGEPEYSFTFIVNYHDGEFDLGWACATLGEAINDGRQAIDGAWKRYVTEGEPA